MNKKHTKRLLAEIAGWVVTILVFIIPFLFMIFNSLKTRRDANSLNLMPPLNPQWSNYLEVLTYNNNEIFRAFKNSLLLTVLSVAVLIISGSMAGYVIQRRRGKVTGAVYGMLMIGLMVPASILPTIWVLQLLRIYKSLFSIVMIEAALQLPFTFLLYRSFIASIPQELEEAGHIDGCSKLQIFTRIVFPLLKPVTASVIILNAVTIFNDFTNPLYFFSGSANITVQMTLYNYMGQFQSSYNLLFADVIIITLPMLLLFIIFNRQIISGMVAGAVKG